MFTEERLVAASTHRVWELVGDIDRWAQMLPTMQQVTRLDAGGPIAVGARFEVRQPGLPKAVYAVTDWLPGRGFTWVASSPGVRTTASHRLFADGGDTRLVLGIEWSGPLAGIVRMLLGSRVRRMIAQEADAFGRLGERDPYLG